jgi:acetylornithine deacetylase/succinyl-diaminopimelate desuccinylase-like protein
MTDLHSAIHHVRAHQDYILQELKDLAAIPSISTLPEHRPDMERAAEYIANVLKSMGMKNTAIMPTAGHPVVYGEWLGAPVSEATPTVLVYGHYDVQPVDPLDEWRTDPFTPTVQGETVYARGVSDMKGQVIAVLAALATSIQHGGGLNCNVKVLIEGEEEIGSPNLNEFIKDHASLLKCDFSLNCDSGMLAPNLPAIVYGLRGLTYFELWVHGPEHDLHSGQFGGTIHNPAQALCELIAGMHDAEGRVTLPGYYDQVRTLTTEERADFARIPYDEAQALREAANPPMFYGEKGYTNLERTGARPTLEVNGLYSGFIGEGSKTVLPAKAMAKISMRIVPDQDPEEVETQLRAYLTQKAPPTIRWELKALGKGGPGILTPRESVGAQAAAKALETVFGVRPVSRREGGSVPVVSQIKNILGVDSVIMGFGLPDDNIHAPNERLRLPGFYRGIEAYIHFFANL